MEHSLVLGSLSLDERARVAEGYSFAVLADGMSFGVAQGVREVITSLLADGDLTRTTRYGNREVTFAVEIEGPDLQALALGEAALRAEVGRTNTLTWTAPDVLTVPTVFPVIDSSMSQNFNDLDELRRKRTFELTLTCEPFARAAELVTVAAITPPPAGSPTTQSLNTADTTSGWSATVTTFSRALGFSSAPATVTDVGDGVYVSASGTNLSVTCDLAAPVNISSTPYVVVDMAGQRPAVFRFLTANGVNDMPVAMTSSTTAGTTKYFFDVGSRSTTVYSITFLWSSPDPFGAVAWSTTTYDIWATNTLPSVTTHQTARVIDGRGTERAPASINISPGTSGASLGWTIVHTSPNTSDGYSPALRQFRTLGNTRTADTSLMSGEREAVNTSPVVAQVPLSSLPNGEYSLAALMRSTVAGTFQINWQARTLLPGIGYLGGTFGTASAKFDAANAWTLIPLDVVTLPPVRSNGAYVQLDLSRGPVAGEVVELDEWWALRVGDDCATTALFSGGAFLWLDSPDISSPVPRVWTGGNGDRSDAHHPGFNLYAQGAHFLSPEGTAIFVATSGLQHPNVSATFHPRWHSNAAE